MDTSTFFHRHLSPRMSRGLIRRLPRYANIAAVILLASALADLTWLLFPAPERPGTRIAGSEPPAAPVRPLPQQASPIAAWHLFGRAVKQAAPIEAPETKLRLTLKGVVAPSTPRGKALAIVAGPDGNEDYYGIGDRLPGNATLHSIHEDRIILRRNGRYETLRLPEARLSATRSTPGVKHPIQDNGRSLRALRDTLLTHPLALADRVRITPVRRGGTIRGWRLEAGSDRSLLERFGLRPGDVVTAVNNIPLTDPSRSMQALRRLANADRYELRVLRNGRFETVTVHINP